MSEFAGLSDHFIMRMHEFIRNEVQADAFVGDERVLLVKPETFMNLSGRAVR